jgi:hypothetical protein
MIVDFVTLRFLLGLVSSLLIIFSRAEIYLLSSQSEIDLSCFIYLVRFLGLAEILSMVGGLVEGYDNMVHSG